MAFNIKQIDPNRIESPLYLFDANLWIKILRPPFELKENDEKYLEFFEKFKNCPTEPKVVLTTLIISEVVNRIIREFGLPSYWTEFPDEKVRYDKLEPIDKKKYFKSHYRKEPHYKTTCDSLFEEFSDYEKLCVCQNDEFGVLIPFSDVMTITNHKLDFNDHYYVLLAKKKNIPIITDDIDFCVEDVNVFTYNYRLVKKAKDSVVPSGKATTIADIMKAAQEKKQNEADKKG